MPFPPPENLPDSGIKPSSPVLQVVSLPLSHMGSPKITIGRGKYGEGYGGERKKKHKQKFPTHNKYTNPNPSQRRNPVRMKSGYKCEFIYY